MRRVLGVAWAAALVVTAPAAGVESPSDATAVVTGSGKRYVLTVTNTGALPIRCLRFRPAYGARIVDSDGTLLRNAVTTAGPNPGKTSRTKFRTSAPYPPRAGGELILNNPSFEDTCVFPGRRIRVSGPPRRG